VFRAERQSARSLVGRISQQTWCRVSSVGVQGPGFRFGVQGVGCRVCGAGCRVSGFGFRVSGVGWRVKGLRLRVEG